MWLIVVGILLVGFGVIYGLSTEGKHHAYKSISLVLWVAAVALVFTVSWWGFFLAVVAAIAAYWIGKKEAYQEESHELGGKIDVKQKQMALEDLRVREPHVEQNTRLRLIIEREQAKNDKRKIELERRLIETAHHDGLTPDEVVNVNKEKYLSEIRLAEREGMITQDTKRTRELTNIELERRWKEVTQDLDAGDLLDLSDQQLIRKQTEHLEEMYRRRYELLHGPDPDDVKIYLLARYDKNIQHLEAKIDARQAGLLLSENGQKTKRLTGEAKGGSDYPHEIDPDDY